MGNPQSTKLNKTNNQRDTKCVKCTIRNPYANEEKNAERLRSEKDINEVAGDAMQFYAVSFGRVRKICVTEVPVEALFRSDFLGNFVYENGGGQTRTGGDRSRGIYSFQFIKRN